MANKDRGCDGLRASCPSSVETGGCWRTRPVLGGVGVFVLALLVACGGDAPNTVVADPRSGVTHEQLGTFSGSVDGEPREWHIVHYDGEGRSCWEARSSSIIDIDLFGFPQVDSLTDFVGAVQIGLMLMEGYPPGVGTFRYYEAPGISQLYLEERELSRAALELSEARVDGSVMHLRGRLSGELFRLQRGYTIDPEDSRRVTAEFDVALPSCKEESSDAIAPALRSESQDQAQGTIAARVQDHQWLENAQEFQGRVGAKVVYECGPGPGPAMLVWGTDVYSDDSFVCWAAVHAGAMKVGEAAKVVIEILPGQTRYQGSERNGVTSMDWDTPWVGSFRVVGRE